MSTGEKINNLRREMIGLAHRVVSRMTISKDSELQLIEDGKVVACADMLNGSLHMLDRGWSCTLDYQVLDFQNGVHPNHEALIKSRIKDLNELVRDRHHTAQLFKELGKYIKHGDHTEEGEYIRACPECATPLVLAIEDTEEFKSLLIRLYESL